MINEIINRVNIETTQGDRAFLLVEGDIFNEPADVYLFNAYKDKSGALMEQLKKEYGESTLVETPFFHDRTDGSVSKIDVGNGKIILILHTDIDDFTNLTVNQYEHYIKLIFASLTALETLGENVQTIALPVLFRNGLNQIYTEAIQILIREADEWLRSTTTTETIKYVLYKQEDATLCDEKLNNVLGRTIVTDTRSSDLLLYKNRARTLLRAFDATLPFWEDTILPLQKVLQNRSFSPEVVAAFSRKLLEVYSLELVRVTKGTTEGVEGLNEALSYMREHRLHTQLDIQTFYQIRSFGNPSVHRPDPLIGPKTMKEKDMTILLMNVCRLLELFTQFIQVNWSYSLFPSRTS